MDSSSSVQPIAPSVEQPCDEDQRRGCVQTILDGIRQNAEVFQGWVKRVVKDAPSTKDYIRLLHRILTNQYSIPALQVLRSLSRSNAEIKKAIYQCGIYERKETDDLRILIECVMKKIDEQPGLAEKILLELKKQKSENQNEGGQRSKESDEGNGDTLRRDCIRFALGEISHNKRDFFKLVEKLTVNEVLTGAQAAAIHASYHCCEESAAEILTFDLTECPTENIDLDFVRILAEDYRRMLYEVLKKHPDPEVVVLLHLLFLNEKECKDALLHFDPDDHRFSEVTKTPDLVMKMINEFNSEPDLAKKIFDFMKDKEKEDDQSFEDFENFVAESQKKMNREVVPAPDTSSDSDLDALSLAMTLHEIQMDAKTLNIMNKNIKNNKNVRSPKFARYAEDHSLPALVAKVTIELKRDENFAEKIERILEKQKEMVAEFKEKRQSPIEFRVVIPVDIEPSSTLHIKLYTSKIPEYTCEQFDWIPENNWFSLKTEIPVDTVFNYNIYLQTEEMENLSEDMQRYLPSEHGEIVQILSHFDKHSLRTVKRDEIAALRHFLPDGSDAGNLAIAEPLNRWVDLMIHESFQTKIPDELERWFDGSLKGDRLMEVISAMSLLSVMVEQPLTISKEVRRKLCHAIRLVGFADGDDFYPDLKKKIKKYASLKGAANSAHEILWEICKDVETTAYADWILALPIYWLMVQDNHKTTPKEKASNKGLPEGMDWESVRKKTKDIPEKEMMEVAEKVKGSAKEHPWLLKVFTKMAHKNQMKAISNADSYWGKHFHKKWLKKIKQLKKKLPFIKDGRILDEKAKMKEMVDELGGNYIEGRIQDAKDRRLSEQELEEGVAECHGTMNAVIEAMTEVFENEKADQGFLVFLPYASKIMEWFINLSEHGTVSWSVMSEQHEEITKLFLENWTQGKEPDFQDLKYWNCLLLHDWPSNSCQKYWEEQIQKKLNDQFKEDKNDQKKFVDMYAKAFQDETSHRSSFLTNKAVESLKSLMNKKEIFIFIYLWSVGVIDLLARIFCEELCNLGVIPFLNYTLSRAFENRDEKKFMDVMRKRWSKGDHKEAIEEKLNGFIRQLKNLEIDEKTLDLIGSREKDINRIYKLCGKDPPPNFQEHYKKNQQVQESFKEFSATADNFHQMKVFKSTASVKVPPDIAGWTMKQVKEYLDEHECDLEEYGNAISLQGFKFFEVACNEVEQLPNRLETALDKWLRAKEVVVKWSEDIEKGVMEMETLCKLFDKDKDNWVNELKELHKIKKGHDFLEMKERQKIQSYFNLLALNERNLIGNITRIFLETEELKRLKEVEQTWTLGEISEEMIATIKLLINEVGLEMGDSLQKYLKEEALIKWLKDDVQDTSEVKVLCDLAMLSADEDELQKVSKLMSAVNGFEPVLFGTHSAATLQDAVNILKRLKSNIHSASNLIKQWEDTAKDIDWFQKISEWYSAGEKRFLKEVQKINGEGIYYVGPTGTDDSVPTVESCLRLDFEKEKKGKSLSDLEKLQTSILLLNIDAKEKDHFINLLAAVKELALELTNLLNSGCDLFVDWEAQIRPVKREGGRKLKVSVGFVKGDQPGFKTEKDVAYIADLANDLKQLAERQKDQVRNKRKDFYFLNEYSMHQIKTLSKQLAKFRDDSADINLVRDLLFITTRTHTTETGLIKEALQEAMEKRSDVEDKKMVHLLVDEYRLKKNVATAAVQEKGCADEEKCLNWAMKYSNDKKKIQSLCEKFYAKYGYVSNESNWSASEVIQQDVKNYTLQHTIQELQKEMASKGDLRTSIIKMTEKYQSETLKFTLTNHLQLGHLGEFLNLIRQKTMPYPPEYRLDVDDGMQGMLPTVPMKEGRPNLLVLPEKAVLTKILAMYQGNPDKPLPTISEILICTSQTSEDEVERFMTRALCKHELKGRAIYCLAFAHKLRFEIMKAAEKMYLSLNKAKEKLDNGYQLVILTSSRNDYLSTCFMDCIIEKDPRIDPASLRRYLVEKLPLNPQMLKKVSLSDYACSVRVVVSERSGVGKSLFIRRITEKLSKKLGKAELEPTTTVRLLEAGVDLDSAVTKLCDSTPNPSSAKLIHIDVAQIVKLGLEQFIFKLFILGSIQHSTGRIWLRRDNHVYALEMTILEKDQFDEQHILMTLPKVTCIEPKQALEILQDGRKPGNENIWDETAITAQMFQRPFQYLTCFETNTEHLDKFKYDEDQLGDFQEVLQTLLRHSEMQDPSWAQLTSFSSFLSYQLVNIEQSIFLMPEIAGDDLPGLKSFALKAILKTARDLACSSLQGHNQDADSAFEEHQLKESWTVKNQPYFFFNDDRETMTFLNVRFSYSGRMSNIKDPSVRYQDRISRDLARALRESKCFELSDIDNLDRERKLRILHQLMNINIVTDSSQQVKADSAQTLPETDSVSEPDLAFQIFDGSQQEEADNCETCHEADKLAGDPDPAFQLTSDNILKIIAMHVKLKCNIPLVVMGDTGCGKTRMVEFMCKLKAQGMQEIENMIILKIHGGMSVKDFYREVRKAKGIAEKNQELCPGSETILFFDEANTTLAVHAIKEVMCDGTIDGEPFDMGSLRFIAACNPYKKLTNDEIMKLDRCGLGYSDGVDNMDGAIGKIPLRHLVYRVVPLPLAMQELVWNFGQLSHRDERVYTEQMAKKLKTKKNMKFDINFMVTLISEIQEYMRRLTDECKYVSLRDTERCMDVYEWLHSHSNLFDHITNPDDKVFSTNLTLRALLHTVSVCYHASVDKKLEFREHLAEIFRRAGFPDVTEQSIAQEIAAFQDIFSRGIKKDNKITCNEALRENVFMMAICIDLKIPLYLIGKPGSSKSLAKSIVQSNMTGKSSSLEVYREMCQTHMISFQCSSLTEAHGIEEVFSQCMTLQTAVQSNNYTAVVVLDEIGLAEASPNMPLKILHPLLEFGTTEGKAISDTDHAQRVGFIGISNWAIDPAKMNRGIFVTRQVPNPSDLAETARNIFQQSQSKPVQTCTGDVGNGLVAKKEPNSAENAPQSAVHEPMSSIQAMRLDGPEHSGNSDLDLNTEAEEDVAYLQHSLPEDIMDTGSIEDEFHPMRTGLAESQDLSLIGEQAKGGTESKFKAPSDSGGNESMELAVEELAPLTTNVGESCSDEFDEKKPCLKETFQDDVQVDSEMQMPSLADTNESMISENTTSFPEGVNMETGLENASYSEDMVEMNSDFMSQSDEDTGLWEWDSSEEDIVASSYEQPGEAEISEDGMLDNNKIIDILTQAYLRVESATRDKDSKRSDFFGLRDFYYLIKRIALSCHHGEIITTHILNDAITKNFSGSEPPYAHIFWEKLRRIGLDQPVDTLCTEKLIRANLKDDQSRFLLLLTEHSSAFWLLEWMLESNRINAKVVFGSSFPGDQGYSDLCENIRQIKSCMVAGQTVVLVNQTKIHESLYDVLNQHYDTFKKQRYVDIGLGGHRGKCTISNGFRLIIVEQKETVYRNYPVPLINRLEKHHFSSKIFTGSFEPAELSGWMKAFTKIQDTSFCEKDAFAGYFGDAVGSLLLMKGCEDIDEAKNLMISASSSDAIFRLEKSRLEEEEVSEIQRRYFRSHVHDNLAHFLRHAIRHHKDAKWLFYEILSFSPFLTQRNQHSIERQLGLQENAVTILSLQEFKKQQEFTARLHEYFQKLDDRMEGHNEVILLIQCQNSSQNTSLIESARFHLKSLLQKRQQRSEGLPQAFLTAFVLSTERPRAGEELGSELAVQFTKYNKIVYVDELNPARNSACGPSSMHHEPLSNAVASALRDDKALLMQSIFGCASIILATRSEIKDSKQYIENLSRALENQKTFQIICQKIVQLIKEKDEDEVMLWSLKEALSKEHLLEGGSFCNTLYLRIEECVTDSIAFVLSSVDQGQNFKLVLSGEKWIVEIWQKLCEDFRIAWRDRKDKFTPVVPSLALHQDCKFPFSFWLTSTFSDWSDESGCEKMLERFRTSEQFQHFCQYISEKGTGTDDMLMLYISDAMSSCPSLQNLTEHELEILQKVNFNITVGKYPHMLLCFPGSYCILMKNLEIIQNFTEVIKIVPDIIHTVRDKAEERDFTFPKMDELLILAYRTLIDYLKDGRMLEPEKIAEWKEIAAKAVNLLHMIPEEEKMILHKAQSVQFTYQFLHQLACDSNLELYHRTLLDRAFNMMMLFDRFIKNPAPVKFVVKVANALQSCYDDISAKILLSWGDTSCGKCDSRMDEPVSLQPCGHHICSDCWEKLKEKTKCHKCKSQICSHEVLKPCGHHICSDCWEKLEEKAKCHECKSQICSHEVLKPCGHHICSNCWEKLKEKAKCHECKSQICSHEVLKPCRHYICSNCWEKLKEKTKCHECKGQICSHEVLKADEPQKQEMEEFKSNCTGFLIWVIEWILQICNPGDELLEFILHELVMVDESRPENYKLNRTAIDLSIATRSYILHTLFNFNPDLHSSISPKLNEKLGLKSSKDFLLALVDFCESSSRSRRIEDDDSLTKSWKELKSSQKLSLVQEVANVRGLISKFVKLNDPGADSQEVKFPEAISLCCKPADSTLQDYLVETGMETYGKIWCHFLAKKKILKSNGLLQLMQTPQQDLWCLCKRYTPAKVKHYSSSHHEQAMLTTVEDRLACLHRLKERESAGAIPQNPVQRDGFDFFNILQASNMESLELNLSDHEIYSLFQLVGSVAVSTLAEKSLKNFARLAFSPRSATACYLPTMPQHRYFIIPREFRLQYLRSVYECPNGHLYTVDRCTQPMETTQCPDCKTTIGGRNHVPIHGNRRIKVEENTQIGYFLHHIPPSSDDPTERMSKRGVPMTRFILHASLLLGLHKDPEPVKELLGYSSELETKQYLIKRLLGDIKDLSLALDCNQDDAIIIMHSVLLGESEIGLQDFPDWSSVDERMDWERKFQDEFLARRMSKLNEVLLKAHDLLLEQDNTVYRLRVEGKSKVQQGEELVWNHPVFWTQIKQPSIEHVLQSAEDTEKGKILKLILRDNRLELLRYLEPVVKLQEALVRRFQNSLDLNETEKKTFKDVHLSAEENNWLEEYIKAWNQIFPTIEAKYGQQTNMEEHWSNMSHASPIAMALPSMRGRGHWAARLATHLVRLQNNFLDSAATNFRVSHAGIDQLSKNHFIVLDRKQDLMPLIKKHMKYEIVIKNNRETHFITYNIEALEKQVIEKYARYKRKIKVESLPRMEYLQDIGVGKHWESVLEMNGPQDPLTGRIMEEVIEIIKSSSFSSICAGVRDLTYMICFVAKIKQNLEQSLTEYLETTLLLPVDRTAVIPKSACIKHSLALYSYFAWYKSVRFSLNDPSLHSVYPIDDNDSQEKIPQDIVKKLQQIFEDIDVCLFTKRLNEAMLQVFSNPNKPVQNEWSLIDELFEILEFEYPAWSEADDAWKEKLPSELTFSNMIELFSLAVKHQELKNGIDSFV